MDNFQRLDDEEGRDALERNTGGSAMGQGV
jgi:hypothetical protein